MLFLLAATLAPLAPPDMPPPTYIWPDGAPGAVGTEEQDKPALFLYEPPKNKRLGTAVVLCPGGGYAVHAMDHEGHQVAKWFNERGVTVALLRYRLGERYRHPAPLQDVLQAIRLVRSKASDLKVSPERIGVMGFSAGGHLASSAATLYETDELPDVVGPTDGVSPRPDFCVLCYPVISLTESYRHKGSGRRLLGPDASEEQLKQLSTNLQVTAKTPPTFLFHTAADPGVPVQNSIAFFSSLLEHDVPCELHAFETGPHGVGMAPGDPTLGVWPDLLWNWMRRGGFLSDAKRVAISGGIKVNNEPVMSGDIFFESNQPGGPTAYGRISRGKYSIPAGRGPAVGSNRVRVTDLGGVAPLPSVDASKQYELSEVEVQKDDAKLFLDWKNGKFVVTDQAVAGD